MDFFSSKLQTDSPSYNILVIYCISVEVWLKVKRDLIHSMANFGYKSPKELPNDLRLVILEN